MKARASQSVSHNVCSLTSAYLALCRGMEDWPVIRGSNTAIDALAARVCAQYARNPSKGDALSELRHTLSGYCQPGGVRMFHRFVSAVTCERLTWKEVESEIDFFCQYAGLTIARPKI